MPICFRCKREVSDDDAVRLPDAEVYCANCCENMATDSFEMETGERFSEWIENHPRLVMRYQPLELGVRRLQFLLPLICAIASGGVILLGCWKYAKTGDPLIYMLGFFALLLGLVLSIVVYAKGFGTSIKAVALVLRLLIALQSFGIPIVAGFGIWEFGRPAGYIVIGLLFVVLFGALAWRGLVALVRAKKFQLTLEKGLFQLSHGERAENFSVSDLTRACVVRPGTVGATEGALGFKDGRMLTLDTCLSDLHALGVVLDLRFRDEFPPSAEDIARARRDKLRKIRGLS